MSILSNEDFKQIIKDQNSRATVNIASVRKLEDDISSYHSCFDSTYVLSNDDRKTICDHYLQEYKDVLAPGGRSNDDKDSLKKKIDSNGFNGDLQVNANQPIYLLADPNKYVRCGEVDPTQSDRLQIGPKLVNYDYKSVYIDFATNPMKSVSYKSDRVYTFSDLCNSIKPRMSHINRLYDIKYRVSNYYKFNAASWIRGALGAGDKLINWYFQLHEQQTNNTDKTTMALTTASMCNAAYVTKEHRPGHRVPAIPYIRYSDDRGGYVRECFCIMCGCKLQTINNSVEDYLSGKMSMAGLQCDHIKDIITLCVGVDPAQRANVMSKYFIPIHDECNSFKNNANLYKTLYWAGKFQNGRTKGTEFRLQWPNKDKKLKEAVCKLFLINWYEHHLNDVVFKDDADIIHRTNILLWLKALNANYSEKLKEVFDSNNDSDMSAPLTFQAEQELIADVNRLKNNANQISQMYLRERAEREELYKINKLFKEQHASERMTRQAKEAKKNWRFAGQLIQRNLQIIACQNKLEEIALKNQTEAQIDSKKGQEYLDKAVEEIVNAGKILISMKGHDVGNEDARKAVPALLSLRTKQDMERRSRSRDQSRDRQGLPKTRRSAPISSIRTSRGRRRTPRDKTRRSAPKTRRSSRKSRSRDRESSSEAPRSSSSADERDE